MSALPSAEATTAEYTGPEPGAPASWPEPARDPLFARGSVTRGRRKVQLGLDAWAARPRAGSRVVPAEPICKRGNAFQPTCKRWDCPYCGPRTARRWELNVRVNLEHGYGRTVCMVAITPPGADRLPWDEAYCAHRQPHKHGGPRGCRVERRAAREWSEMASANWSALRAAAATYTRKHAPQPVALLDRVWEPQRRGVPHLHLILGFHTLPERRAAEMFVRKLRELAPDYGFGFVDGKLRAISGAEAARYVARYVTGRSKHKTTIRENVSHPNVPKPLIWQSPAMSSVSEHPRIVAMRKRLGVKRPTGVSIRTLRRACHVWAWARGVCDEGPAWTSLREAAIVGVAYRLAYGKRGEAKAPPLEDVFRLVDEIERRIAIMPPGYWMVAQQEERKRFADELALSLAGLTPQQPAEPRLAEAA